jgi:hypothetical protein
MTEADVQSSQESLVLASQESLALVLASQESLALVLASQESLVLTSHEPLLLKKVSLVLMPMPSTLLLV